MPEDRINLHAE